MRHTAEEIADTLRLLAEGRSPSQTARRTGIPRRTVADWAAGRVPKRISPGEVCERCGGVAHTYRSLPDLYAYLLGLYLGDGYIAGHPRGVYKLRITLDAKYPGIVQECGAAMHAVLPTAKVARLARCYGDVEVYSYSRAWPCLFPQHGPGKKHLRPIVLAAWQGELVQRLPGQLLRGLVHSDGCRFMNTGTNWRHPRYSFSNMSADIRRIFCDACDVLGVRWTTAPRTVYVSRKADVARLDEFIGPKT